VVQACAVAATSFLIRFLPEDRGYKAAAAVELYLAAAAVGILVEQPCGSQGTCGRCRVRVVEGAPTPTDAERDRFTAEELNAGWRLACQLRFESPATVEIPSVTRSLAGKSFGADLPAHALARPVVHVGTVTAPVLSGASPASSVLDALGTSAGLIERALTASPSALSELASADATADSVSVAIQGRELVSARAGRGEPMFGLAIDIGTTSLAAALVSLEDGAVAASASSLNPQVAFGADVISRIRHTLEVPEGGAHLSAAVREGLAALVDQLAAHASCRARDIVIASVAGNPTMTHAWLGVPVASLGRAPYAALWTDALTVKAGTVGLPIHPNANVLVFPLVRSHVGGDAVAAAVASDLDRGLGTGGGPSRLLIDLGTNTELLLVHDGRLVATSAAAGPAFEGVSIRHGMRAAPGAIDVVSITPDGGVVTHAIGGVPARGVCGSGLIDAVAELLSAGIVTSSGSVRRAGEVAGCPPLAARLSQVDGQQAFALVAAEVDEGGPGPVLLTARDVREVQLAKGSIVAAATLLCRHVGLEPSAIGEVLVAGAFGNYIRKSSAVRIGLLPPVDAERIRLVGNAAGVGAKLALLDHEVMARGRELAARAEYVDLAMHPGYQAAFISALAFPFPHHLKGGNR
jgi:uncharacterized 2Fe-2S/4Fe-4S cluster protein (DUF4445 family)